MSFPRYDAYTDSGVEWLGEVPSHWRITHVRHLLRPSYDGMKIGPFGSQLTSDMLADEGYKVFGQENVIANDFVRGLRYIDERKFIELSAYEITAGDILITMMGTSGRCAVVPPDTEPGIMDSHLLRVRTTRQFRGEFLRVLIDQSPYMSFQLRILGNGSIMHGLNSSIVRELLIVVPKLSEQDAILTFINRETAKIDALVEEQQRLIALLKEKRQAVISHAVTKGLDPNAPMRDSGVEWLGEAPAHWEVRPLGRLCTFISYGFTNPMPTADDGPFMLTANDIDYGSIRYETARRTSDEAFTDLLTDKSRPQAGDILLTKDGTLGRVAVHDGQRACINQSVALLRPDVTAISPQFLCSALVGGVYQDRMIYEAGGTTIKHIYISRVARMPLAVPSFAEQMAICRELAQKLGKQDDLLAAAETAITLLQERRSALISAAVTGKIDVRGLAPAAAEAA